MFNSDQLDYMDYLSKVPPEKKCYCGWYLKDKCFSCPKGYTAADKLKARCKHCHSAPEPGKKKIYHVVNCKNYGK